MRLTLIGACVAALTLARPGVGWTQSSPADAPLRAQDPLTSTYDTTFLAALPTRGSLFSVIDTLQPTIIADRFASGGLALGERVGVGGFLTSPRDASYALDGLPFTDAAGLGAPWLAPDLALLQRVTIRTGAARADDRGRGLAIALSSLRGSTAWHGSVDYVHSSGGLNADGVDGANNEAPPIVRLDRANRVAFVAAGPLTPSVTAVFGVTGDATRAFTRANANPASSRIGSAYAQITARRSLVDDVTLVGWVAQSRTPLAQRHILATPLARFASSDGYGHLVWSHNGTSYTRRLAVAYGDRQERPDLPTIGAGTLERLTEGSPTQFATLGRRRERTWTLSASVGAVDEASASASGLAARSSQASPAVNRLRAGIDIRGSRLTTSSSFTGTVGEMVHGGPARVWRFATPSSASARRGTTTALWVADHMRATSRLALDAGVRVELLRGSAEGAAHGVAWTSLLPRASATVALANWWALSASASYARSGASLALDDLAIGDPNAPTASVYRWNAIAGFPASLTNVGARVALVGPGTGGDSAFSAIDPALQRPITDEVTVTLQAQPTPRTLVRLSGIGRIDRHLWDVVNVGAPASTAYTSFLVSDPGSDVLSASDDTSLVVFNRVPASFGRDRYLWTTATHQGSSFRGLELTLQYQSARVTVSGGATAGEAHTYAASVGYGLLDNDSVVLGDLFVTPNADGLSRGRPFTDRAYTGKFAFVYRAEGDVTLGLLARYQDGQPFSRVVVFPGLNQGGEAVRAFANGDSRFTFVGTLDARLQKRWRVGARDVDVYLDVFNLPGMHNSVEEDVAADPDVRTSIAVQPPRSAHIGLRIGF